MGRTEQGQERRRVASDLAQAQGGVVSRAQLRAAGIDRFEVRTEIRAGRWRSWGARTVAVTTGDLADEGRLWRAVWETGGSAALDGASALTAAGLTGFEVDRPVVSHPHGHTVASPEDVDVRSVIAREAGELAEGGIPRVRPAIAALRGASWAVSDRQGALLLCMSVQQGITTAEHIAQWLPKVALWKRRTFIARVVADLLDGAKALGEIDFAQACRERGLPEPTRQAVRRTPTGRIYLDVAREEYGLVVEIDGSQHRQGLAVTDDNLRQNEVTLGS
ncbi:hypothetical protein [Lapillicoccus jejuensis]|uniref:DUF559 domain-containing protein n=1 Tax=Lapillicoccus jejuensis TaxID=402171 RepID=A0A542E245_9MICO|nr:hypothetical protein [Lapillicoccus jejuensis]TQJ09407.1 hypothetical protein FB458_2519 [Lapillicoccus jejuensis]